MRIAALLVFLSFVAVARAEERVFQFQNTGSVQNFNEAVLMIRTIADIQKFQIDEEKKSFGAAGTAKQLGLADWMFRELDRPGAADSAGKGMAIREYVMDGGADNVVRIFYLPNTKTVQMFQQIATLVRTIGDIRRVFTYNAPRALAVRGTADQIALSAWLIEQLDRGADAEYQMPATSDPLGDTVVHVFHIAHAATVQDFQEIATAIRTIGDIRRVFTYNEPRLMVTRCAADQTALAKWLAEQIDVPPKGQPGAVQIRSSMAYEFQSKDPDSTVRVFFLSSPTAEEFQATAAQIRMKTGIRRVFTYNAPRAMALRGNANQMEMAARLVAEVESGGK